MRCWILFLVLVAAVPARAVTELGTDLSVDTFRKDVWIHRSSSVIGGTPVQANGLIVWTGDGWLLVDTPFDDAQTARLIDWARTVHDRPVELAVLTHSHEDRAGGIAALTERGVTSLTHTLTSERLAAAKKPRPTTTFEDVVSKKIGDVSFEVFFPGAGHAPDNIVVWFPEWRLLHGGCLIKGTGCRGIGYIGDADLGAWPATLERVRERHPAIETILPGHDGPGGLELLDFTRDLVRVALVHRFVELQIQEWKTKESTLVQRLPLISPKWVKEHGAKADSKLWRFNDHAIEEHRPGELSEDLVRVTGVNRSNDWAVTLTFELGMEEGRLVIRPSKLLRKGENHLEFNYITAWKSHDEPVSGILPPGEKPPQPPARRLPAKLTVRERLELLGELPGR